MAYKTNHIENSYLYKLCVKIYLGKKLIRAGMY